MRSRNFDNNRYDEEVSRETPEKRRIKLGSLHTRVCIVALNRCRLLCKTREILIGFLIDLSIRSPMDRNQEMETKPLFAFLEDLVAARHPSISMEFCIPRRKCGTCKSFCVIFHAAIEGKSINRCHGRFCERDKNDAGSSDGIDGGIPRSF